jgi:hypothetical protein
MRAQRTTGAGPRRRPLAALPGALAVFLVVLFVVTRAPAAPAPAKVDPFRVAYPTAVPHFAASYPPVAATTFLQSWPGSAEQGRCVFENIEDTVPYQQFQLLLGTAQGQQTLAAQEQAAVAAVCRP